MGSMYGAPTVASSESSESSAATPVAPASSQEPASTEKPASSSEPGTEVAAPTRADEEPLTLAQFTERYIAHVVPRLAKSAQVFLSTSRIQSLNGSLLTIALPSEPLRSAADKIQGGLRRALENEFQQPLQISWTVDTSIDTRANEVNDSANTPPTVDEIDDLDDREIAEAESVDAPSIASLLISEAFPGAEELS